MEVLGIDIGGSGVKGAIVDVKTGELLTDRYRIPTPQPATPEAVLRTIEEIVTHFEWRGAMGCGYPGVVKGGKTRTAANVHERWVNFPIEKELERLTEQRVRVINDADAAGLAEMRFGAGRNRDGVVLMITLGTGIGVAMFNDGRLVPNLELGHIEIEGEDAETRAADSAREREDLSWKKWAKRVDKYLSTLEKLLWPDLFIIGGGVSKEWDKFSPFLERVHVEILPAEMRNQAGIVGAALAGIYEGDIRTIAVD